MSTDLMKGGEFAQRAKAALDRGVSLRAIALRFGCTCETVRRWAKGTAAPMPLMRFGIARALDDMHATPPSGTPTEKK